MALLEQTALNIDAPRMEHNLHLDTGHSVWSTTCEVLHRQATSKLHVLPVHNDDLDHEASIREARCLERVFSTSSRIRERRLTFGDDHQQRWPGMSADKGFKGLLDVLECHDSFAGHAEVSAGLCREGSVRLVARACLYLYPENA